LLFDDRTGGCCERRERECLGLANGVGALDQPQIGVRDAGSQLERSAALAEDHAHREEQGGRCEAAAKERLVADKTREAARRAWANADKLR
jgi:hypothetical protein